MMSSQGFRLAFGYSPFLSSTSSISDIVTLDAQWIGEGVRFLENKTHDLLCVNDDSSLFGHSPHSLPLISCARWS